MRSKYGIEVYDDVENKTINSNVNPFSFLKKITYTGAELLTVVTEIIDADFDVKMVVFVHCDEFYTNNYGAGLLVEIEGNSIEIRADESLVDTELFKDTLFSFYIFTANTKTINNQYGIEIYNNVGDVIYQSNSKLLKCKFVEVSDVIESNNYAVLCSVIGVVPLIAPNGSGSLNNSGVWIQSRVIGTYSHNGQSSKRVRVMVTRAKGSEITITPPMISFSGISIKAPIIDITEYDNNV